MKDSNLLRNQTLYQIFVRQYGENHSFSDVYNDLDRIKALGTDIIYLMPIFPIGKINRKGSLGSPYSIYDYTKIDEYLGGEKELKILLDKAHDKGMKVIVDVALNHTSCDATLLKQNEKYYYHKDGKVSRKCDDWSDVIDLDYNNLELHDILIKDMCDLIELGFDGFRMDVCSLIPMVFWRKLYQELIKINPDVIMVGESVEIEFLEYIRTLGVAAPSDLELYEVFDALYQYDIKPSFFKMIDTNLEALDLYLDDVLMQNKVFDKPKLRFLENHDLERIASHNIKKLDVLNALNYMLPGLTFIYAGQEFGISHKPDLFELDPVDFKNFKKDYSKLFKKLSDIRRLEYFSLNRFSYEKVDKYLYILKYQGKTKNLYAIFNFSDEVKTFDLHVNKYRDLLKDKEVLEDKITVKDMLIIEA